MARIAGDDLEDLGPVPFDDAAFDGTSIGDGGGYLLGHLLRFGQLLRLMGIDVSTRQVLDLVEALEHIAISNRLDFYTACKALLVNRREDFLVFDQAFQLFWRMEDSGEQGGGPSPSEEFKRLRLPSKPIGQQGAGEEDGEGQGKKPADGEEDQETASQPLMIYSPEEILRQKDFGEMSWEEIQDAKRAIASLDWKLGERRTRRVRPSYKGRLNMSRVIRDNLRHGGEPIRLAFRQRVYRPRSLVVLCDISGSMERYSRMLLHFIHSLTHGLVENDVEAFVFGTRLTRITRHLRYKDVDESLDELGVVVRDWSGGTRIGEALKVFNFQWARRVLGRGAVVLIISDGWDRGDLNLLAKEVFRLQRSAYRLIWLNPLLGSDEYRPIQRGMATVMPCVDDFLPVHNLVSLDQLAELLSSVTTMRPMRKQRICAPEAEAPEPEHDISPSRREPDWFRSWAARVSHVG
jgi:uncharacterized protein with von Willebrand factor type A (vWA) domain